MIQFINSRINTSLSKTFSKFFQNLEECPLWSTNVQSHFLVESVS